MAGSPAAPSNRGFWAAGIGFLVYVVVLLSLLGAGFFNAYTVGPPFAAPSSAPTGPSGPPTGPPPAPPIPPPCTVGSPSPAGGATTGGPATPGAPVSVYSHAWAESDDDSAVTPALPVAANSTLLVFVGYVGPTIGGPAAASVCDSSGDVFVSDTPSTPNFTNHSAQLFVAFNASAGSNVFVAAAFADTSAPAGGTLAVVDVSGGSATTLSEIGVGSNNGVGTDASVYLNVSGPSLLVLGLSGQGGDGPFIPGPNENLLDTTGYFDAGPWTDGESFGTMVGSSSLVGAELTATLQKPYVWNGIAVEIGVPSPALCYNGLPGPVGGATLGGPALSGTAISVYSHAWAESCTATAQTPPMAIAPGSTLVVFVGYVGSSIGGPYVADVSDSSGDVLVAESALSPNYTNHSAQLFVAVDVAGGNSVVVTATFEDSSAAAGGTLAVIDLDGSTGSLPPASSLADANGVGPTASVEVNASGPSVLLLGLSGQGKDGPFVPGGGEVLLDTTGYFDVGPWTDGEAFGTMISVTTGGSEEMTASLAEAAVWNALAVAIA